MTLPMTKRSHAVSSALTTIIICLLAASLIVSALMVQKSNTPDRWQSYKPSSGQLYRLSPIPPGADWTS